MLLEHFAGRQDRDASCQLPLGLKVMQNNVNGGGEVKAVICLDMDKPVAEAADDLWDSAVFRTEDIDRVLRVNERGKRLGVFKQLNADRRDSFVEKTKWLVGQVVSPADIAIALHALLSGKPVEPAQVYALTGPNQTGDIKARGGADGGGDVVDVLGIDQD